MCVDGSVTGSTGKIFVLTIGDMLMSFTISILFGQTKIDHIDNVGFFSETEEEVIGLDISMDIVSTVNKFNSGNLFSGGLLINQKTVALPFDRQAKERSLN